ncbi:gag-pol polyprotein [Tanacetum coccineum]
MVKDICRNNQRSGNLGRNGVKIINMIREGGNRKRPFEEGRSGLTEIKLTSGNPPYHLTERTHFNIRRLIEVIQSSEESRILEVAAASDGRFLGGENISSGSIDLPQITMGRAGRRVPGVAGNNRKHKTGKTQRKCSPSSMNVQTKVFAWARLERTNVPRFVMEHSNLIDLTFDRTSSPIEEMTNDHQSAKRIGIERQGVLMAKGRDDQKVQDVEETLRKLKRVNIKIDPVKSSFGVKEGGFLGYMVAKEGEGEILMLCLRQKDETISSVLLVEREGIQILVSYVSQPLQGMDICYTPTEKMVQALVHTTRSLRAIFRKHKVKTYDILYTQRKEAEGSIVKKFFGQGEQVQETLDANEGGTFNLNKKLQAKSTPIPRSWRLYLGKETIEEGSGVGIILVSLKKRMHSYAIRLKFNASDHAIDCEALLAGLAASIRKGMKDLHVFMDSPKLVAQTERNHTPATEQERKYKKEIMDAIASFHRFRITYLPKILNSKAEVLTRLTTIKLEFLNQELSVGIITRLSVEETSSSKKGKATSNVPSAKPNYNWERKPSGSTDMELVIITYI